jgi:hypothetical protein
VRWPRCPNHWMHNQQELLSESCLWH